MTFLGGEKKKQRDSHANGTDGRIESLCLTHFSLVQSEAAWFVCKHGDKPFAQIPASLLPLK